MARVIPKIDIHKSTGILINRRKLLVVRSKGKHVFITPGGKIEKGETPEIALIRELFEELGIHVTENQLEWIGAWSAPAAEQEEKIVLMETFLIHGKWKGIISPHNEIEELLWINSAIPDGITVGSMCRDSIIPFLKDRGEID